MGVRDDVPQAPNFALHDPAEYDSEYGDDAPPLVEREESSSPALIPAPAPAPLPAPIPAAP